MKQLFSILLTITCLTPCKEALSQADISMSTHWYNRAGYNPAFIARTDYLYLFSNVRQQWIGVDGAPTVVNVQVSDYIHNLRSAFGLSFVSDKIGATQVFNPMFSYAFRISNKRAGALSLGLSGGVFYRTVNGSLFEAEVVNDPSINYTSGNMISPDANAGIEFQNTSFIIGLSSTHLFSIGKQDNSFLNANHRYGYIIYKNNKSELFYYKLGLQVVNRYNSNVIEGNVFVRFKHSTGLMQGPREIFDFGLTVRSSRQLTFLLGVLITPNLRVGYAYDHNFIKGYYRNGSHEIMIEYRIFHKAASTRFQCGIAKPWYQ
jgi:type IX secretion system PorP/SprF family membrane protein